MIEKVDVLQWYKNCLCLLQYFIPLVIISGAYIRWQRLLLSDIDVLQIKLNRMSGCSLLWSFEVDWIWKSICNKIHRFDFLCCFRKQSLSDAFLSAGKLPVYFLFAALTSPSTENHRLCETGIIWTIKMPLTAPRKSTNFSLKPHWIHVSFQHLTRFRNLGNK